MFHKDFFRRLLMGFYVLAFSGLLLGLTRYSYRAKELLVCWLVFCSFFAVLALVLFGAVLATFAGQRLLNWVSVAKLVIPDLVVALAETPQGPVAVPQILATGTLEFAVGPCAPVVALDSASYLLVEAAPLAEKPFSEMDVPN